MNDPFFIHRNVNQDSSPLIDPRSLDGNEIF